jgi:GNAT superfamily N-acetyltransferase
MVEISLLPYSDCVKHLLELHRASFGYAPPEPYWRWKFSENPMANDVQKVVVAIEGGAIVGARPYMFGDMWVNEKKVRVAQHCHTMVHPKHRRKGIFARMEIFALEQLLKEGIAFSYGFPNKLSRGGFLKVGYKRVIDTMAAFRAIDSYFLISTKIKSRILARTSSALFNLTLNRKKRFLSENSPFEFEVLSEVTAGIGDIEFVRSKAAIDLVRSRNFLQWRFDSHPLFEYKYILAKRHNQLFGYAVISVQKQGGITFGRIVDHVVTDSDIFCYRHLINQSLLELEKQDCDCYEIFTSGEPKLEKALFEDFGFKSFAKFPYNRFVADRYLDAIEVSKDFCNNNCVLDKKNWRVTFAFYDQI